MTFNWNIKSLCETGENINAMKKISMTVDP